MIIIMVIFTVIAALILFGVYNRQEPKPVARFMCFSDPSFCHLIIEGKAIPGFGTNQIEPVSARALENKRLQASFGIDNAFTSDHEPYVKRFKSKAKKRMQAVDWDELSIFVQEQIRARLERSATRGNPGEGVRLSSLVQVISLLVVLVVLLQQKKESLMRMNRRLVRLAEEVTSAWISSKQDATCVKLEDNPGLINALEDVFPDINREDHLHNPLNFILPGFETLWRVVLRAIIEIRYRDNNVEWQNVAMKFASTPTSAQFLLKDEGSNISAKFLAHESLRLYPPTRRVHRAYKFAGYPDHFSLAADIEACHISTAIWGADAEAFRPERWATVTSEQQKAYFPFGSGVFTCPAQSVFGPRVIMLLVGSFITELQHWNMVAQDSEVMEALRLGKRLKNERQSLDDLYIHKSIE
ncbi:hypothetical protein BDV25DRAFT_170945 [Aspergillus avenaceus]|uniref:Cytochrome P450 n=1 Tax=Aspergillus avenaceus TaxID=36643 RepID=A0A5N6TEW5_ASPAV|nr:hypothetical protein BDV25DRAFT_170945 [Aspergillus avenaceus]